MIRYKAGTRDRANNPLDHFPLLGLHSLERPRCEIGQADVSQEVVDNLAVLLVGQNLGFGLHKRHVLWWNQLDLHDLGLYCRCWFWFAFFLCVALLG